MALPQIDDYLALFLNDTPMMDLRAPVEFAQGAFPNTLSLPLMSDDERQKVGTCYKEQGQDKAIELGYTLVSGEVLGARMALWATFVEENPDGVLYCFRGGLRSRLTQQYIYEQTGVAYPRINGGYKALRRYLINELENSVAKIEPLILSGSTGTGKTQLLLRIQQSVDLEGIFSHRGSAFGRRVLEQPSQIDVENQLSIALLKLRHQGVQRVVFEDEGSNIGSRCVPNSLIVKTSNSPVVVLDASVEERAAIIYQEYVTDALAEYQQVQGDELGFVAWSENLINSLGRIKRRLGGVRHKALMDLLTQALAAHGTDEAVAKHMTLIGDLLVNYYDPMYDYQLSQKSERIEFRGEAEAVMEYVHEQGIR